MTAGLRLPMRSGGYDGMGLLHIVLLPDAAAAVTGGAVAAFTQR